MKVDIVVNSMIQQIDRSLQSQAMPALSFRAGEILRGRVMLTGDDKLQIRLDNGALMNALPAGDVLLMQGATVTLRVSGRMDGNFVMQLLEQELSTEQAAGRAGQEIAKLGLNDTPQGRAVLQSMRRMNLPLDGETARQAMEILRQFPDLEPDKAIFMAANRMKATQAQVDALNRLIDRRATTGGELLKLADMIASQALEKETVFITGADGRAATTPAANSNGQAGQPAQADIPVAPGIPASPASPQNEPKAPGAGAVGPFIEEAGIEAAQSPVNAPAIPIPGKENISSGPAAAHTAAPAAPASTEKDGMLRLQSLVLVALGPDAAERYSGMVAALGANRISSQVAALALDGPFMDEEQLAGRLQDMNDSLPQGIAKDARAFAEKLIAGISKYIGQNNPEALALQPPAPEGGMQRIVREIMDLFVPVDRDGGDEPGASLAKAVGAQKEGLARIAAEAAQTGAASPETARQLDAVSAHVRLLGDISQYACQQIPVQVNGRNCTAEIYVLNRGGKRGKKINPDSANMLIALDTEHMGRVEALASISRKNLRLRFGVERPGLMGHISSYTAELAQAMQEIGYRLSDVRTQVISRPVDPVTVMQAVEPAGAGSLDVKV